MKAAFSNVFVATGFSHDFSRLVKAMDDVAPRIAETVVMQIGNTQYEPKNCDYFRFAPSLADYIARADVVVSHAAMTVVDVIHAQKPVVVVPRQARYGEHLNDHQVEFAEALPDHPALRVIYDVAELESALLQVGRQEGRLAFTSDRRENLLRTLRDFVHQVQTGNP